MRTILMSQDGASNSCSSDVPSKLKSTHSLFVLKLKQLAFQIDVQGYAHGKYSN